MCEMLQKITEEDVHALVDGALDPDRQIEVEAAIAEDADLKKLHHELELLRRKLHILYDGVLKEPIPERLMRIIKSRDEV